jgi:hypothetical protein
MKAFRRKSAGYAATFEPEEARMLTELAGQVTALMGSLASYQTDPALRRLLPDAYRDDAAAATEFRRFTAEGLAERKTGNARVVIDSLKEAVTAAKATRIVLDPAEAQAWIRAITDIRLSIGARLGIEADDQPLPFGEPLVEIYQWLAFVQESLVTVLR